MSTYLTHVDAYLSASAQRDPNKIAIVDHNGARRTTFAKLNELGQRLGSQLIALGLERQAVLIILPKSMEALACFTGVTKSNNFYTIFEENAPLARLTKVIAVLKPQAIITRADYAHRADLAALSPNATLLAVEDIPTFALDLEGLEQRRLNHIDTDLLYVLFTSGSTGEPKGVTISHRSVIDYVEWLTAHFGFNQDTVFLNQAPFYFDNSVLDIYSTLSVGATLHLIDSSWFIFPAKVVAYLSAHQVTTIFWVPSVLCYFANTNVLAQHASKLNALKQVIFCGEPMPTKQLNVWRRHLPQCRYTNLYGPTEITDVCAYFEVERDFSDDEILPIGYACHNTQLLVFEQTDDEPPCYRLITPADVGQKGVLFVRGSSLSLGYYGNQSQTQARFIQNPLQHNYLDRLYDTGDIVAYNTRGELVCYGRADNQIKYQGNRIELGEIEAVVSGHPEINACACVFTDHITLFYVSTMGQELDLSNYLKERLPTYMLPTSMVLWPRFELNQNGKIDRLKLKAWLQGHQLNQNHHCTEHCLQPVPPEP